MNTELLDLIKLPTMKEWDNKHFDCEINECVVRAEEAINWHSKTICEVDIKINHSRVAAFFSNSLSEVWQVTVLHGKGEAALLEIGMIETSNIINWLIRVHEYEGIC